MNSIFVYWKMNYRNSHWQMSLHAISAHRSLPSIISPSHAWKITNDSIIYPIIERINSNIGEESASYLVRRTIYNAENNEWKLFIHDSFDRSVFTILLHSKVVIIFREKKHDNIEETNWAQWILSRMSKRWCPLRPRLFGKMARD